MEGKVQSGTHLQHVITDDAFGLDEDLVDHGVTMVTVHFVDAMLVGVAEREQHLQRQSLGFLAVAQFHRLEPECEANKRKKTDELHFS